IKRNTGLHPTRVTVVVAELVEQGFLTKDLVKKRQVYAPTGVDGLPELSRYENQHQVRGQGLDAMLAYAEGGSCLMQTLRSHLGDAQAEPCGHCGMCTGKGLGLAAQGTAADWMGSRPVIVRGFRSVLAEGRALYDSGRRSGDFRAFMGQRGKGPPDANTLQALAQLAQKLGPNATVVPIPSSSWAGRDAVVQALGLPVWDGLAWRDVPEARQGTLLNNDQRKANVDKKMMLTGPAPSGPLILLDDYVGSGATLREAARALKQAGHKGKKIPLTVARVRWRLGRPGIV
ncbi:MAG: hypothetical protein GWP91_03590, partial [Rhodobacterales bacterium]|nr:hypothetical protein [Rhodobacterales bacterium]